MLSIRKHLLIGFSLCCLSAACGKGEEASPPPPQTAPENPPPSEENPPAMPETPESPAAPVVPEFGPGTPVFTTVATAQDGLRTPRDLAFNPAGIETENGPAWQLWTVNRANDGAVILTIDPVGGTVSIERRVDQNANHFMEEVSSIAFGVGDTFGTCQESRNTYDDLGPPNDFMGPALWSSNLEIFAQDGPNFGDLGSHLDMLHSSPLCMGIAHEAENRYFVTDGMNGHVVHYDFRMDHGPGHDDHKDGRIRRFIDAKFTYLADIPGHLELDAATGWLYVADPGAGRVFRLDTASGEDIELLYQQQLDETGIPPPMEPLDYYGYVNGATVETLPTPGLGRPSGLAIANGRLFVSDHDSGEIVAYALEDYRELGRIQTPAKALMGIAFDPSGALWYADATGNAIVRVDPATTAAP